MNRTLFVLFLCAYGAFAQFQDSSPKGICDYTNAISGASASNYCKGVNSGTTMNAWHASISTRSGYLRFVPSASDGSAYLRFGSSCFDARGYSDIQVEILTTVNIQLKFDFGTSSNCALKDASDYAPAISVNGNANYQTITFPISYFANMKLDRLYTFGINSNIVNNEVRIRKVVFLRRKFVTRARHELFEWINGVRVPVRFVSVNIPDLIGKADTFQNDNLKNDLDQDGYLDPYEQEDLILSVKQLGGRVARMYTLRIKRPCDTNKTCPFSATSNNFHDSSRFGDSKAIRGLGLYGTGPNDQFVQLDRALKFANDHGVRLIIPIIDNWRYFGGVTEFAAFSGVSRNDFFTNSIVKTNFQSFLTFLLTRINSITGVRYADDPAIFAWQLGNELCTIDGNGNRNMPDWRWARDMADHIRAIDKNHLIIDGYWINSVNSGGQWPQEMLNIRNLDILTSHYYSGESPSAPSNEYSRRISGNENSAYNGGKAFIVTEYGIARREILKGVLDVAKVSSSKIAGTMLWSLRGYSVRGGAMVHDEYAGFQAYQWPGYTNGPRCHPFFRSDNYDVLNDLYSASQTLRSLFGLPRPSIYPPCSHNGAVLEAAVQDFNSQNISCIQSFGHSGFSTDFRAVNLRIRNPTGAHSAIVQFSLDNSKFITLNAADMTVIEGKFLYAHKIPVLSVGGSDVQASYRIVGNMRDRQVTKPTASLTINVPGVDLNFITWFNSQTATVLPNLNAPIC